MPSKKEKHQQNLANIKAQTTPLANSTNTTPTSTNQNVPLSNSYHSVTTNHFSTITTKKTNLTNDSMNSLDHLSLIRDQKHELDELNNRFSNYVDALRKKTKENNDLQKKVDTEKNKQKSVDNRDNNDLDTKMDELRNDIDESAVLTEHFILKRNRALKELSLLKDKIRTAEDQSYKNRRQLLENEYQQTLMQLKELTRRYEDLENLNKINENEMNQMNDLYKKLQDELHDLLLNNMRLECNLRTIEEKTLLIKAIYETEKSELANEQIKQQEFYTNELDKAIADIKNDFQVLLKNNKVILENAYTERIEQVKTQILTYQANKEQESPTTAAAARISIETLHDELKQSEKEREKIDNEYHSLWDKYSAKEKGKYQINEERLRLETEYNRLINEINQITEAIEVGKQYWFSVHFELETYRRLLDLETNKQPIKTSKHISLANGKDANGISEQPLQQQQQQPQPQQQSQSQPQQQQQVTTTVKKTETQQRAISKSGEIKGINEKKFFQQRSILICDIILGKFDFDQVTAGFVSINNASTNCVDQPLKGWTLARSLNDGQETTYQFPDTYILKARTRVRVYSSKAEGQGNNSSVQGRLIATSIPSWASTNQGDNVKILLFDEKGIAKAQYSETWQ